MEILGEKGGNLSSQWGSFRWILLSYTPKTSVSFEFALKCKNQWKTSLKKDGLHSVLVVHQLQDLQGSCAFTELSRPRAARH